MVLAAEGCGEVRDEAIQEETETEVVLMREAEEISTENLLHEYHALLMTTGEKEDIYAFLEKHVKNCSVKDADQLLNGLIGYLADADAVDYNRMAEQKNYFSEEVQGFIELMRREQNEPAIADNEIKIPLTKLLLRTEELEEHARQYTQGVSYPYVYEKYCELLGAAVTGFYDGESDWTNCYLDSDKAHIEEAAVQAYSDFVQAYPDSNTSGVLLEYLELLKENDREFNGRLKRFYNRIYSVIKEHFQIDA